MKLDIQGHRGCRGLFPENTIPAFTHALELGVTTLELDAVISQDNEVIISHEPFMSHLICLNPGGEFYTEEDELMHNIFQLTYDQIKSYDCGSKIDERFPSRTNLKVHKPNLDDVVSAVNKKLAELRQDQVDYNIEIKRKKEWDGIYHPEFKTFADLVVQKIEELGIMPHTTVQCFDIETLQYIHNKYNHVKLVFLVQNENNPSYNISELGFIPEIYSPYHELVDESLVSYCHQQGMRLIPWTVNDSSEMKHYIEIGVDGIISDYPDRLLECKLDLERK